MASALRLALGAALFSFGACGDGDEAGPDASTTPDAVVSVNADLAVVAGDFDSTGAFSVLRLPRDRNDDAIGILDGAAGGDPVLRKVGDRLVIINRLGGDNVTLIDAAALTLERQIATPAGSNPQDATIVDGKLFVAALASDELLIFDVATGTALPGIDLAALDAVDGQPDCVSVSHVGDKLFVACGQLDENFSARGPGKVAVIDVDGLTVDTVVDLPLNNPVGFLERTPTASVFAGDLLIGQIPDYVDTTTSCLARLATTAPYAASCVVTGAELEGYPNRVAVDSTEAVLWVVVNAFGANGPEGKLRGFDLAAGDLWPGAVTPATQLISDVVACPAGRVAVADRTEGTSGIRIYNGVAEETTAPIAIELAPGFGNNMVCY